MKTLFLLLNIIFLINNTIIAQNTWEKCTCNPIMIKDSTIYEGLAIGSPSVLIEDSVFKMLYASGGTDTKGRISYAYSFDGKNWIKYNNGVPVFFPDTSNSWDNHFLDTPVWLKDSVNYKMYYFGDNDNNPINSGIGIAISSDGITWQRILNNPVLTNGTPGEWDDLYIESPSVVFHNNTYYMYYSGIDSTYRVRIGLATSSDGINWNKHPSNPIITEGNFLDWDGFSVATPTVIVKDSIFEMWYCGVSNLDLLDNNTIDTIKIGHATSLDGITWVKDTLKPVLNTYSPPFSSFEIRGPWAPSVKYFPSEQKYYMWYETAYGFGLATKSQNISSIKKTIATSNSNNILVYPNPITDTFFKIKSSKGGKISIYSIKGKLLVKDIAIDKGITTINLKQYNIGEKELIILFTAQDNTNMIKKIILK